MNNFEKTILVIFILIGCTIAFYVFTVSPKRYAPNMFTLSGGLTAGNFRVNNVDGLVFSVINHAGETIDNATIRVVQTSPQKNCNEEQFIVDVAPGQYTPSLSFCSFESLHAGDRFEADITVTYQKRGESTVNTALGHLSAVVES